MTAFRKAQAADRAYDAALAAVNTARHTPEGRGAPGSPLRKAYRTYATAVAALALLTDRKSHGGIKA